MENTKKKGSIGLLITSILALVMLVYGSFATYRGAGAVLLSAPESGYRVYFLLYKFLLGALFVIGTFLIGKKKDNKGIAITFSIVNMLIAIAAFLPVGRYYHHLGYMGRMFRIDAASGIVLLLHYMFIALIAVFALLIMITALKNSRKQPKALCIAILVAMGVYALVSIVSLMFTSPYYMNKLRFASLRYVQQFFRSRFTFTMFLNPFSNTAHIFFPFATIAVFLAMFFAAKAIRPVESAEQPDIYNSAAAVASDNAAAQYSGKSKVAAAVLAGVIGQLGVHRFYLGRAGSAVVQLLGGISFISGYVLIIIAGYSYRPSVAMIVFGLILLLFGIGTSIWAFVDFIRILCNKLKPARGYFGNAPQQPVFQQPANAQPAYVSDTTCAQPSGPEAGAYSRDQALRQLDEMLAKGLITGDEYYKYRLNLDKE